MNASTRQPARDYHAPIASAVLIMLLGAALRVIFLRAHGIDADDAFSLGLAADSLRPLLTSFATTSVDLHPKLYFVILNLWANLAGPSDLSARVLNLLADLLLGALLINTTRTVYGRGAAANAAWLWAVNPLLLWSDGLVRMYTLLALFGGVAWLFAVRAVHHPRVCWWSLAALGALAAAYTHVLGAVVLAATGLAALCYTFVRRRLDALLALALAGVAYLPYVLNLWAIRGAEKNLARALPASPGAFLTAFLSGLATNRAPLDPGTATMVVLLCALLLIGALWHARRAPTWTAFAVLLAAVAGAGWFALSQAVFGARYIVYAAPAFLLVAVAGIDALPLRALRVFVTATLALAGVAGIIAGFDPGRRDDFPAMATYLETYADPGDAIFILTSYGAPPFEYYYDGGAQVIAPYYGLPADRSLDDLIDIPPAADTLWLLQHQSNVADPDGRLNAWLADRYPVRAEAFPSGATIRGFDLRPASEVLPPDIEPLDITYGNRVTLRGVRAYRSTVSRADRRLHPPSGWVHITLFWEVEESGAPFTPQVRIEGEDGSVWGVPIERANSVLDRHPPATWQPGHIWRTDFDINLNPEMPPGMYKVVVRALDANSAPLPVADTGRDWYIAHRVSITP